MKKSLLSSILITGVASITLGSYVYANTYDDLANDLANSILTQIQNDPGPAITTSGNIDVSMDETAINTLISSTFIRSNNGFNLTTQARNNRLNGGMIAKNLQDAINYMYDQKLTKYNTLATFQVDSSLRRDEAAKFFSLFASQVMKKQEDGSKVCTFSDLAEGHTDLQTNVISSCKLGLFKGTDGKFNPTKALTNGEALTVLIRILAGSMDESSTEHRAKSYRQKAQVYGLTQGTLMDSMKYLDTPITRGDMARLLEAARFVAGVKSILKTDVGFSLNSQGYVTVQ